MFFVAKLLERCVCFFFSSRRRHTRWPRDWSSDVCSSDLAADRDGYLDLVCGPMLAACAAQARWVDAFCERGAFSADEARAVLSSGQAAGLVPRVHANQLGAWPGVRLAVELGAASADHCTYLTDADVDALAG